MGSAGQFQSSNEAASCLIDAKAFRRGLGWFLLSAIGRHHNHAVIRVNVSPSTALHER
jgi:hypothetical protein